MSGPRSLRAALAAITVGPLLLVLLVGPLAGRAAAQEEDEDDAIERDPLQVRITRLTPGVLPERGAVRVRGTIRNTSDQTWTSINVHPFVSAGAITDVGALDEAVRSDPRLEVGERILSSLDAVGDLSPGDEVDFRLRIPRGVLPDAGEGVYWFGVHALGTDDRGRDSVADGRARTFLPLVRPEGRSVRTALVASLRHPITHTPAGALAQPGRWEDALAPGGRLRRTLDLAEDAGSAPLTWLVDPAVVRAVSALAVGNPPRRLDSPADRADGGTPTGSPSPAPADRQPPEPDPLGIDEVEQHGTDDSAAGRLAAGWLQDLPDLLGGSEIRGLPYGDLDSGAALEHDPELHDDARALTREALQRLGLSGRGVVAAPRGRLTPTTLARADSLDSLLVTEEMLPEELRPAGRVRVGGREVTVTSSAPREGGPGPNPRFAPISLRQRVLAEAALRLLSDHPSPLVVSLPAGWGPEGADQFFRQLDALGWLDLVPLAEAEGGPAPRVEPDQLLDAGPSDLSAEHFREARELIDSGASLELLLSGNDTVGREVTTQALSTLSWWDAADPDGALRNARAASYQVHRTLGEVEIEELPYVTLSSETGRFPVTVVNGLDHRVTVQLQARTDGEVTVDTPDSVEIGPGGTASVLVSAHTERLGAHNVEFRVTDSAGNPVSDSVEVPIRSAQVSGIIWVVIGVGAVLLVGTATVRVVRRVRRRTRAGSEGGR